MCERDDVLSGDLVCVEETIDVLSGDLVCGRDDWCV